jgi:hypothetical protein
MSADPALAMTLDDLRFIASLDNTLDVAVANAESYRNWKLDRDRKPCPGCAEPCGQCDAEALD